MSLAFKRFFWLLAVVAAGAMGASASVGSIDAGFYDLGAGQVAVDVSRDGTLVGVENSTTGSETGYIWTQQNGLVSVGASRLRGVDWYNDDGFFSGSTSNTVIVAGRTSANAGARVWFGNADGSGTATWYDLPPEGGANAWFANENALGVKADGTDWWVGGYRTSPSRQAVRYKRSSNSSTQIGSPAGGGDLAQFDGASDTGVFAGRQRDNGTGGQPRRGRYQSSWLDRAGGEGEANDISGDGSISVGWDNNEPVYWTNSNSDRFAIPLLAGDNVGEATGVNEDGSIIVGWSRNASSVYQHWIWDSFNGTRELKTAIESMGVDLPDSWTFTSLNINQAVSLSRTSGGSYAGLTIVGQVEIAGGSPHAYAVHLLPGDFNNDQVVDAADYVVWRKNPGAFGGDPDGYNLWRANFGSPAAGAGSGAVSNSLQGVPEPKTAVLLLLGGIVFSVGRRSGSWHPRRPGIGS